MAHKNQAYQRNTNQITDRSPADYILIGGTLMFILAAATDIQMVFNFSILFAIVYLIRMNN